jgi:plastocyanin
LCEKSGLYFQSGLVGDKNEIQNVLVYVSKGAEQYSFEVPEKAVEVTQKDCQFAPRVFGMIKGQAFKAHNEDPTFHNVRAISKLNPFNLKPGKGEFESCVLEKAEGPTQIVCDVHPWMKGYVAVFEHPFFDVTGPFGKFELKGLAPGEYTITVWHELFGTQSQTLTVSDKEVKTQDFVLEVSAK